MRTLLLLSIWISVQWLVSTAAEYRPPLQTADGFAVPQPGWHYELPRDYGSHPAFKIEWWYVTGHLFGEHDRRFGFQATFFRQAGPRPESESLLTPASGLFDSRELHLAHVALLDVQTGRFIHEERLNRGGWDAGSSESTLAVRNGNWSLLLEESAAGRLNLHGSIKGDAAFSLHMTPAKPLVMFGPNGVSRKGASETASSYYLTFPRLEVAGTVTLNGRDQPVRGQAWMDHEISSSQLGEDQAGWDWAGIELNDGREIMAYRLRKKDGSTDPFSSLAWVDKRGVVTNLTQPQFEWSATGTWSSPATGGVYPVDVKLTTTDPATGLRVTFLLRPLARDQELSATPGGVSYWEGACRVLDEKGREVGSAYLELTGYVGKLSDRFR